MTPLDSISEDGDSELLEQGSVKRVSFCHLSPRSVVLPMGRGDESIEVFSPQQRSVALKPCIHRRSPSPPSPPVSKEGKNGWILLRCSRRALMFKSWRECVWIYCKPATLLFFRSMNDCHTFQKNPALSEDAKRRLVKLCVDFDTSGRLKKKMMSQNGAELPLLPPLRPKAIMKYNVTDVKMKSYTRSGPVHCCKLERWSDVGTSITAAFASPDSEQMKKFRKIVKKCIKKTSPKSSRAPRGDRSMLGTSEIGSVASASMASASMASASVASASVASYRYDTRKTKRGLSASHLNHIGAIHHRSHGPSSCVSVNSQVSGMSGISGLTSVYGDEDDYHDHIRSARRHRRRKGRH